MKGRTWTVMIGMVLVWGMRVEAAPGAQGVVDYDPGVGYATDWQTGAGYTNAAAVLGLPTASNADGPITPFNSPYTATELVSIGAGGFLTLRFDEPILDDPAHAFGMDFLVYGSAAFLDAAWPSGLSDPAGTTFGGNSGVNPGATRVWVSEDNAIYYELAGAPVVDGLFPTDSGGVVGQPVNPALATGASFANKTLAEIRALYAGSAGGTGFDLDWAVDGAGDPVTLSGVRYVRFEVLQNRSEIDAVVAVPEPSSLVLWGVDLLGLLGGGLRRRGR